MDKTQIIISMICLGLVTACGPGVKPPGVDSSSSTATITAPTNLIVNGVSCPGASCPAGAYLLTSGSTITITGSADVNTTEMLASDGSGAFDNQNFTDGAFTFTTSLNPGQTKMVFFTAKDSKGNQATSFQLTLSSEGNKITYPLALSGMNVEKTSGSYKMKSFGVSTIGANDTAVSGTTKLTLGFSNAIGGIAP